MRFFSVLLLAALLTASCGSSTYVTNSWTKPGTTTHGFQRLAVLALVGTETEGRSIRQSMEASIVEELGKQGYTAYSTFAQYGPQRFERDGEEAALGKLKGSNADAILTVTLLDKSKEQNYVPGRVSYTPVGGYYNRFWGYYSNVYDRTYIPGYYTTDTRYFWEANLYDLKQPGDDLVYTAQSESFDPSSAGKLGRQYAKTIVKDMTHAGVVQDGGRR